MHVALAHHLRRGQRDPSRWNHACDYAVNALLVADGFTLWERALHDPEFGDASAEAIYERLPPQQDSAAGTPDAPTPDGAPAAGTDGPPSQGHPSAAADSPSAPEPDDLGEVRDRPAASPPTEADIQRQLADHAILITALAQQSRAAGSETLGTHRAAAIARRPPAVNWRALLADFLSARTANDYSWCRPNPRYAPLGLYIPILEARDPDRIAFVIDTSGSVPDEALTAVTAELEAFLTQHPTTSLLVVYADTQETGRVVLTADDLPLKLKPKGGGGTNFGPVLESLDAEEERPAAVVYLTDLHGPFRTRRPQCQFCGWYSDNPMPYQ
jgi:predicted metal-dependent peptidase